MLMGAGLPLMIEGLVLSESQRRVRVGAAINRALLTQVSSLRFDKKYRIGPLYYSSLAPATSPSSSVWRSSSIWRPGRTLASSTDAMSCTFYI